MSNALFRTIDPSRELPDAGILLGLAEKTLADHRRAPIVSPNHTRRARGFQRAQSLNMAPTAPAAANDSRKAGATRFFGRGHDASPRRSFATSAASFRPGRATRMASSLLMASGNRGLSVSAPRVTPLTMVAVRAAQILKNNLLVRLHENKLDMADGVANTERMIRAQHRAPQAFIPRM